MMAVNVQKILAARLQAKPRTAEGWETWEHKSWNIHRGVLHWQPTHSPPRWAEIEQAVRQQAALACRPSWLREFGFGVIVELAKLPADIDNAVRAVDVGGILPQCLAMDHP